MYMMLVCSYRYETFKRYELTAHILSTDSVQGLILFLHPPSPLPGFPPCLLFIKKKKKSFCLLLFYEAFLKSSIDKPDESIRYQHVLALCFFCFCFCFLMKGYI